MNMPLVNFRKIIYIVVGWTSIDHVIDKSFNRWCNMWSSHFVLIYTYLHLILFPSKWFHLWSLGLHVCNIFGSGFFKSWSPTFLGAVPNSWSVNWIFSPVVSSEPVMQWGRGNSTRIASYGFQTGASDFDWSLGSCFLNLLSQYHLWIISLIHNLMHVFRVEFWSYLYSVGSRSTSLLWFCLLNTLAYLWFFRFCPVSHNAFYLSISIEHQGNSFCN